MEVSISTSKRKFHSLLDNITNPTKTKSVISQEKVSDLPSNRPPKRSRVSEVGAQQSFIDRPVTPGSEKHTAVRYFQSSLKDRVRSEKTNSSVRKNNNSSAGAYAPWSRDLFLERLRTFADIHKWTPKPDIISELHWAKRGWKCEENDTVTCKGLCEQRLVVDLATGPPKYLNADDVQEEDFTKELDIFEDELAERYHRLIIEAHSEQCPWRKAGCKDDIYRLPLLKSAVWRPTLISRYKSFDPIQSQLPMLTDPSISSQISKLRQDLLADQLTDTTALGGEAEKAAFKLALFGWRGELVGDVALAQCDSCFQRIGLWLYNEVSTDGAKESEPEQLDLITSHKFYCPWINAESQCAMNKFAGKAGWQILQDLLMQNYSNPENSEEVHEEDNSQEQSTVSIDEKDNVRLSKLQQLKKVFGFKKKGK